MLYLGHTIKIMNKKGKLLTSAQAPYYVWVFHNVPKILFFFFFSTKYCFSMIKIPAIIF